MASSSKKKTTMAKITREQNVRERRLRKQAKKDARKLAASQPAEPVDTADDGDVTDPDAETAPERTPESSSALN